MRKTQLLMGADQIIARAWARYLRGESFVIACRDEVRKAWG